MAAPIIDMFLTYQFIRRLATPFEQWDAYHLGIIDKDGNVLKSKKEIKTPEEKKAWGYFDILVANIKKLMGKIPGGSSKIASYGAALWLIKEMNEGEKEINVRELEESFLAHMHKYLVEEVPVNNAGGGQIAAIGIGPQGEPGRRKKTKLISKVLRRNAPFNSTTQKD